MDRRSFVRRTAGMAGAAAAGTALRFDIAGAAPAPDAAPSRETMAAGVVPISDDERRARIEKARRLMIEQGIAAIFLEPGSSMFYYTGVRWGTSERPFGVVIPARGELAYITPGFEEERARELIKFATDVRVWQEDESPYHLVAQILRDRGAATGKIGIEERLRFFIFDGIRQAAPAAEYVIATPVTAGCRMFKSPAEIALMQRANDLTVEAFRTAFKTMKEGMSQDELAANVGSAFTAVGAAGGGGALVLFGQSSSFPHGSIKPQTLRDGDVVLVDGGCAVEGYQSDVTRTTVFGMASQRQRDVWEIERRAQDAALAAATVGATCESVDAAARKVITDAGFGPGYALPGLPHRTGHGIGLDGHEWTNFVRGNTTRIQPGMCFSDEPTIAIHGEFGIRLEDCLYITDSGPRTFTKQSESIDKP
jgi:Xaa-Pro aminopeptidase